jgi:hypothetical protein
MAFLKVMDKAPVADCVRWVYQALLYIPGIRASHRLSVAPIGTLYPLGDCHGLKLRIDGPQVAIQALRHFYTMSSTGELQFPVTFSDPDPDSEHHDCTTPACLLPYGKDSSQLVRVFIDKGIPDPALLASLLHTGLSAQPQVHMHWLGLGGLEGKLITERHAVTADAASLQAAPCSISLGCNALVAMVSGDSGYLTVPGKARTELTLPLKGAAVCVCLQLHLHAQCVCW